MEILESIFEDIEENEAQYDEGTKIIDSVLRVVELIARIAHLKSQLTPGLLAKKRQEFAFSFDIGVDLDERNATVASVTQLVSAKKDYLNPHGCRMSYAFKAGSSERINFNTLRLSSGLKAYCDEEIKVRDLIQSTEERDLKILKETLRYMISTLLIGYEKIKKEREAEIERNLTNE